MTVIYIAFLLTASAVLVIKTRTAPNSQFKNIFWALASAVIMKTSATIAGYERLISGLPLYEYALITNFSDMSAVVSNIFLFHFGVSILTYKIKTLIDYKIFPTLLFAGYMILYISGIIDPAELSMTSRISFGYNGAILGCVGCVNIYYERRKECAKDTVIYGFLLLGMGLFIYSVTEGLLTTKVFSMYMISMFKVVSAAILAMSAVTVTDLMKEERTRRIGFV